MTYYIIIAGQGSTTRANIEALIDDTFLAENNDCALLLPFESSPSLGQKWAAQFAKDNNVNVYTFSQKASLSTDFPYTEHNLADDPMHESMRRVSDNERAAGFLLWDDEDTESARALVLCRDRSIRCFDLTNGLIELSASPSAVAPPPPVSMTVAIPEVDEEPAETEEEEEEEEEVEVEETLTDAITFIAQIFAREIAAELKKMKDR